MAKRILKIIFVIILIIITLYILSFLNRAERFLNTTSNYDKNYKVLDLGVGNGFLTRVIRQRFPDTVPLDINDEAYGFHSEVYDGKKIPYPDKYFDVVHCGYVLHHAPNQMELLDEMIRVSKNKIIIEEDTPVNSFDRYACSLHSDCGYGGDIKLFHSPEEWKEIFESKGLKVEMRSINRFIGIPHYPVQRYHFVLTVP
jgi:SAM-dependent methyltransferase